MFCFAFFSLSFNLLPIVCAIITLRRVRYISTEATEKLAICVRVRVCVINVPPSKYEI